eukprot:scaffold268_cov134-Isochrysis_galbana.AAC.8
MLAEKCHAGFLTLRRYGRCLSPCPAGEARLIRCSRPHCSGRDGAPSVGARLPRSSTRARRPPLSSAGTG